MMSFDKSLMSGSTMLMLLSLLESEDMYGYQMIKELEKKSENIFSLKEGTLYPILHSLERQSFVVSYILEGDKGKKRKYYQITNAGRTQLKAKKDEWIKFCTSVNKVVRVNGYEL